MRPHPTLCSAGKLNLHRFAQAYQWMSRRDSPYVHRAVNHSKGEFARTEMLFGQEARVSTNAVEGLFGYFRQRGLGRVGKNSYGHLLAEFMWRQRPLARFVFSAFTAGIVCWNRFNEVLDAFALLLRLLFESVSVHEVCVAQVALLLAWSPSGICSLRLKSGRKGTLH